MPDRFRVERRGRDLTIRWRWFQPKHLAMLAFVAFWDGFLVVWYVLAFESGAPLAAVLFPVFHVAIGALLTYLALGGLVNSTSVTVQGLEVRVRHGPLPWWPSPTIPVNDLEQLYVERQVTHSKGRTNVAFEVRAVTRDDSGKALVEGLETLDQALYLEQEIEDALGIRDAPVARAE